MQPGVRLYPFGPILPLDLLVAKSGWWGLDLHDVIVLAAMLRCCVNTKHMLAKVILGKFVVDNV